MEGLYRVLAIVAFILTLLSVWYYDSVAAGYFFLVLGMVWNTWAVVEGKIRGLQERIVSLEMLRREP